jgi:polar amino acid transport system permease protein
MFQNAALTWNDALLLLRGLGMTIAIFAASFAIGTAIGFALALCRQARVPVFAQATILYVELFRNSPLLVHLFLLYFGVPIVLGIRFTPLEAALVTISINTGAYMTVIVLSAIEEVPRGQWEAGRGSGLSYLQLMRRVVLPQAMPAILPPAAALAVNQLHVTSLASLIGVMELAKAGSILNVRNVSPYLVWPLIGLCYFVVSKPLSLLSDWAEARLAHRRVSLQPAVAR